MSPIQNTLSMSQAPAQSVGMRQTRPAMPSVWMKRALLTSPATKIIGTLVWIALRGRRSTRKPHRAAASGKPTR